MNLTQTEKDARLLFSRASVAMMSDPKTAFYSHLLMEQQLVWGDQVPIAGVDAYGRLYLNAEGLVGHNVQQTVFVLWHELEHVLRLHPQRLMGRDPFLWNVAGDKVINADRKRFDIGQFIEGCIDSPECAGMLTETVYGDLQQEKQAKQKPDQPDGQGGDGQSGDNNTGQHPADPTANDDTSDEQEIGGTGGDLVQGDPLGEFQKDGKAPTAEDIRNAEAKAKASIARAAQAARVAGNLSADMQRRVEGVLSVHTPWYEIVERFMTDRAANDYSWTRPNRRFVAGGTYLPSMQSQGALGTTVVIRDVSGSCDGEQDIFMGHFNAIAERCTPSELYVLDTSTRVHTAHHFKADDLPAEPEITGGGGTDLRAGFDWINRNISDNIDVVIVLTDGYTGWPSEAQDYPVVVVCTTNIDVEYGDELVRFHPDAQ